MMPLLRTLWPARSDRKSSDTQESCAVILLSILNLTRWGSEWESYRAANGRLDRTMPIFRAMNHSLKLKLKWFNAQLQVAQMIQENIRQAGRKAVELSHDISRATTSQDGKEWLHWMSRVGDAVLPGACPYSII